MQPGTDPPPAPDSRRLRGLVAYLARQESLRFEDLDFSHPLLAGSTMAELREAMAELARRSSDPLCEHYAYWMGAAESFSVGAGSDTDWMPLIRLRYHNLQFAPLLQRRSLLAWSCADAWLVHHIKVVVRTETIYAYAIQSLVSQEPAGYFVEQAVIRRVNVDPAMARRLPPSRPINAALNEDLAGIMKAHAGAQVTPFDPDFPLHQYLIPIFQRS